MSAIIYAHPTVTSNPTALHCLQWNIQRTAVWTGKHAVLIKSPGFKPRKGLPTPQPPFGGNAA